MKAIFIDCHGVLLDLVAGLHSHLPNAGRATGVPDLAKHYGAGEKEFWESLNNPHFWFNLPVLDTGLELLRRVREISRDLDIPLYVLTRPVVHSMLAVAGTVEALMRLDFQFEQIIIAHDKAPCATGGFLIDDCRLNCLRWAQHGGQAFAWPSEHWPIPPSKVNYDHLTADCMSALLGWAFDVQTPDQPK